MSFMSDKANGTIDFGLGIKFFKKNINGVSKWQLGLEYDEKSRVTDFKCTSDAQECDKIKDFMINKMSKYFLPFNNDQHPYD